MYLDCRNAETFKAHAEKTTRANALRVRDEQRQAARLVRALLAKGWAISVFDSEEWACKRATSFDVVWGAMGETDDDTLRVRDSDGANLGFVQLVWGNGAEDLIADCSADGPVADLCNEMLGLEA
jgi:hypothetical protein